MAFPVLRHNLAEFGKRHFLFLVHDLFHGKKRIDRRSDSGGEDGCGISARTAVREAVLAVFESMLRRKRHEICGIDVGEHLFKLKSDISRTASDIPYPPQIFRLEIFKRLTLLPYSFHFTYTFTFPFTLCHRLRKHLLNGLEKVEISNPSLIASVGETELVTAVHNHVAAFLIGCSKPLFECPCSGLFADKGNGSAPASHVEHLVQRPVRGIRGDFHEKLGRGQGTFVHHFKYHPGHMAERACTVRICASETDGLIPVVCDGTPLPEEMLYLFAKFRLGSASGGNIGIVVRRKSDVEFGERTALDAIEMFGIEEVQPNEHHCIVRGLRRTVAKTL